MIRRYFLHSFLLACLVIPSQVSMAASVPDLGRRVGVANVDVTGVVTDSTNGQPLESAEVTIGNAGGAVVANTTVFPCSACFGSVTYCSSSLVHIRRMSNHFFFDRSIKPKELKNRIPERLHNALALGSENLE